MLEYQKDIKQLENKLDHLSERFQNHQNMIYTKLKYYQASNLYRTIWGLMAMISILFTFTLASYCSTIQQVNNLEHNKKIVESIDQVFENYKRTILLK